jgi:hypothetical protein
MTNARSVMPRLDPAIALDIALMPAARSGPAMMGWDSRALLPNSP